MKLSRRRGTIALSLIGLATLSVWIASFLWDRDSPNQGAAAPANAEQVSRGEYLAAAGNCVSCHTKPGAAPYTGGVAFQTPFGTIYSSNITPDAVTGIGKWTEQDLRRAMHEGVSRSGASLFPAFPYDSYTKVTDQDVASIYAYLRSVKPVRYEPPSNDFLLRQRWALRIWKGLFFDDGRFVPDPKQSEEWNRGAYLTEGLAHCGACHTPRNRFMAQEKEKAYGGGNLMHPVGEQKLRRWSAVNITSAPSALGNWSVNDLTKYLHTGVSTRAGTFGPMNDVIVNSLSRLRIEDIRAMAVYIKSLPPIDNAIAQSPSESSDAGATLYEDHCRKCHGSSGRGGMFNGPPLAGSAIVQASDPASLVNVIMYGPEVPPGVSLGAWEEMKAYKGVLDDAEFATLASYVRSNWGNRAPAVTVEQVQAQR